MSVVTPPFFFFCFLQSRAYESLEFTLPILVETTHGGKWAKLLVTSVVLFAFTKNIVLVMQIDNDNDFQESCVSSVTIDTFCSNANVTYVKGILISRKIEQTNLRTFH